MSRRAASWRLHRRVNLTLDDLAEEVNPADAGLACLLRRVLSGRGHPTLSSHRPPSGAMGAVEVQAAGAQWSSSADVVARGPVKGARAVRALAVLRSAPTAGRHEPYESRGSRGGSRGPEGEIPSGYPAAVAAARDRRLEDKILQRAVVEVLNAIYEADFLGVSYGFRPGRSPHHALDALAVGIKRKVSWVLDLDFRDYFSRLDHQWLERFLEHRIADKRVLRLIQKWMAAGVVEDGSWTAFDEGVPQGASASPLLANVYAHYVFDLWAHQWRRRHARGQMVIVRFADDAVVGFEYREDAERFHAELRGRLAQFNLELAAEKTRLIEFGRFAARDRERRGLGKPKTFRFLGFTHICGKTRTGRFQLKRITDSKRIPAKLAVLRGKIERRQHLPVDEQGRWLASALRGHYQYYAVPDNIDALHAFREQAVRYWFVALRRRSQRTTVTWERMSRLADRWLPQPQILHPWPEERFHARTQGRSRVREGAADKAATQLVKVQPRQLSMSDVKRRHIPVRVTGRAMRGVKGLAARRASAAVGAAWRPSECRSPKVIE